MAGYDKFQIDMAKGRFTFPVAILICLLLRIITGNEWQDVINLLVCALTAYLLIEINTAFTLIRTRSTLHVSFYVFLSTACLFLHSFQYAVFAPLTFLIAISQLFSSYESPYPREVYSTLSFSSDWEACCFHSCFTLYLCSIWG